MPEPIDDLGASGTERRLWLKRVAAAGVAASARPTLAAALPPSERDAPARSRPGGASISAGRDIAVALTPAGRVAGYVEGGVFAFKGIPYGADTSGPNRFRPPQPPPAWTGVRSSRSYGPVSPQDKGTGRLNDEEAFIFQWNDSVEGEDCLRLNVWTPALDGKRRAVLVWLHGGGFTAGSGHDLPAFDGHALARSGDVVVVTLNHRLNLLGFLDLSHYGAEFAEAGNVGMLDIVAALRWIRNGIAEFGGDPDRVLVSGQSGGGGKVSALMAMPSARGLFHRAVVMSGSFASFATPARSRRLADLMLDELRIAPGNVETLRALPYSALRRASEIVLARENPPREAPLDVRRMAELLTFAPVLEGRTVIPAPDRPDRPAFLSDVPLIVGSTLNEFATGINHPEDEAMTEAELVARVEAFAPGRATGVIRAFRRTTPDASPFDLWSRIATASIRQSAVDQAMAHARQARAPTWLYWFTWQTPILDGRPRAFHCLDIPFMFANTERCASMTGGGPRAATLSRHMSRALVSFAATGDPGPVAGATWHPVTTTSAPTMIFDDRIRLERNADMAERLTLL